MLKKILFILLVATSVTNCLYAQIVIGKPSLGFQQACANPEFNTFKVGINYSSATALDPENLFIVELSNPEGDFTVNSVVYNTVKGEITASGQEVSIAIPTASFGDKFRVRVKSTIPAQTGQNSAYFPAYYKAQDSQYTINNLQPTATFCAGGSFILAIDPNGNGVTNSPLEFPFLTYNWYRESGSTIVPPTLVAAVSTATYTVTQPGVYYVETNYGSCSQSSYSYSNRVTVTESATAGSATITSSKGNPFCSNEGTVLSTSAGQSYQWYKNDVVIAGATSQSYSATEPAKYSVKVDYGGCQANASIALQVNQFNSSINVPEAAADTNVITPGESLDVVVTTDANNPKFQWYLNEGVIAGATSANYAVTVKGSYKVMVTQTGTCEATKEHLFKVRYDSDPDPFPDVANIPNLISPNDDFINDTWILPKQYVNGTNAEVVIISSNGKIILQTTNYQNDWPSNEIEFKNINPVYYYIITTQDNTVRKGSITVIK